PARARQTIQDRRRRRRREVLLPGDRRGRGRAHPPRALGGAGGAALRHRGLRLLGDPTVARPREASLDGGGSAARAHRRRPLSGARSQSYDIRKAGIIMKVLFEKKGPIAYVTIN